MKYVVHQLGNVEKGNVVEVSLKGNAATVIIRGKPKLSTDCM